MARRRKKASGIELIFVGSWKVSAVFALIVLFISLFIIPTLSNPILKTIGMTLRPVGFLLVVVLIFVAILKFFQEGSIKKESELSAIRSEVFQSKPSAYSPSATSQTPTSDQLPHKWSLQLIQEMEWKRFEDISTSYFLEKGIRAETTSLGADGGIDIKLYQDDSGKPTSLVQCKAWYNKYVGVKEIREFLGVLTHEKIAKGFYMTSGVFSEDAKVVAKTNGITLINGEMFLMMIQRLSPISQNKLLAYATSGDYKTPTCVSCGSKMIRRKGDRNDFWGCSNFPKCRHKLNIRKENQ